MSDYFPEDIEIEWDKVKFEQNPLLCTGFERLLEEFMRINDLMKLTRADPDKHPLGSRADRIIKLFKGQTGKVNNDLSQILNFLYEDPPDPGADQLEQEGYQKKKAEAWNAYTRLRRNDMSRLSNELLAVLGGVYLHQKNLENMRGLRSDQQISFTDMAEKLAKEIADYADQTWTQVLIVGEENPIHTEAEIIRLRFPACDLWNMPLIAFEYGYLLSHKEPNLQFRNTISRTSRLVNPGNHPNDERPETDFGFLDSVKKLWDDYYRQETQENKALFLRDHRADIAQLQTQQENLMHRLFADAFAAYIAGPAYVYALLYLGAALEDALTFTPESLPLMDVRLMVCLKTLNWMNNRLFTTKELPQDMVERFEVDGSLQPPALWSTVIQAITQYTPQTHYAHISREYDAWLEMIQGDLLNAFSNGHRYTKQNWQRARDLENFILGKENAAPPASQMAILNSAWHARHTHPAEFTSIQYNAMRLLASSARQAEGEEVSGAQVETAERQRQAQERQADIDTINQALDEITKNDTSFYKTIFDNMLNKGEFPQNSVASILKKLASDPPYPEAYAALERLAKKYA